MGKRSVGSHRVLHYRLDDWTREMKRRITNNEIHSYVANRYEFVANSTKGKWYPTYEEALYMETGRMSLPDRRRLAADLTKMKSGSGPMYAIHSYHTPIAWWLDGAWFVSDEKYSQTTSCAQGRVRRGAGFPPPPPPPRQYKKRIPKQATPEPALPTDWWVAS